MAAKRLLESASRWRSRDKGALRSKAWDKATVFGTTGVGLL